ncbi:hypothetical protein [Streptomyces sp. CC219B]|uniref:hypothetical protein n=1 Tax=Streptomyces sp. CC219B TaxID=3044574 RepID=UPI0024A82A0C|nr:hypothetical protein [Streptomyces sp. CC219B]
MTWPAALPGAAVRVLRAADGRCAPWLVLRLVLLVGGLFALGVLCGQQARAADDVPTAAPSARGGVTSAPADGLRSSARGAVGEAADGMVSAPDELRNAPPPAPALVTDVVVPAVDDRVVRPVGEVVGVVTDGLAERMKKLPPLPSLPPVSLPESPTWPGVPEPGLPGSPGLPALPEPALPEPDLPDLPDLPASPGVTLPAPDTAAPQPGPAAVSPGNGEDAGRSTATASARPYGRGSSAHGVGAPRASVHATGHRPASVEHAPVRQAPTGDPGSAPGNRSAADSGTPRNGDTHAVALNHTVPLGLLPGTAVRVEADGLRDAYRDIPVSPA